MIEFKELKEFNRGMIYRLLCESYSGLLKLLPEYAEEFKSAWLAEDGKSFTFPETIGKCVLASVLDSEPIGFVSWDPRKIPEEGIIGQNCIVPSQRGKGFGKIQIHKVMEIFLSHSTPVIKAATGNLPFFIPAQKTYLSCGFKVVSYGFTEEYGGIQLIHFEYRKNG